MSASQPMLPVRPPAEPPPTMEYEPVADEPPWLIGRWRTLAEAFDLHPEEVCQWHHALAGQGRPWLVIRRIHAVAPMWGDGNTAEDAEDWTFPKLAAALGVPSGSRSAPPPPPPPAGRPPPGKPP